MTYTNTIKPFTSIASIRSRTLGLTVETARLTDAIADMAHETALVNARLARVTSVNALMKLHLAAIKAGDAVEEQRIRKLLGW